MDRRSTAATIRSSPRSRSTVSPTLHSPQPTRLLGLVVDQIGIAIAVVAGGVWAEAAANPTVGTIARGLLSHGLFIAAWALLASRLLLYEVPVNRHRRQALRLMLETWLTTWGIAGLATALAIGMEKVDLLSTLWVGVPALGMSRWVLTLRRFQNHPLGGGLDRRRTLLLGACDSAYSLATNPESIADKHLLGFVPFPGEDARTMRELPRLGGFDRFEELLQELQPDLVVACPSDDAPARDIGAVFRACDRAGTTIHYFPSFLQVDHLQAGMAWNSDRLGLALRTPYNRTVSKAIKRAIDFVGSSIGILLLLPVFVACAIAVKLSSKGPVFYRQTRVGMGGRHFTCFKFRSMRPNSDGDKEKLRAASIQDGPAFKIPNDPRITPAGRFLRKFSLDELPQLFNVWIGDMSLVGPRPPVPSEVAQYTWWQRRRIMVKPGLTCVWQVWGRNRVSFKRWVEMDLYYIDNWSLWMDVKLIVHTVRAVFRGTGM